MNKTTLILGAGISMDYGYPSSDSLIDKIIEELHPNSDQLLIARLKGMKANSIDWFLQRFPEHRDRVSPMIARVIMTSECQNTHRQLPREKDFYAFILNGLLAEDIGSFQVLTFNYDRSLEYAVSDHMNLLNKMFPMLREDGTLNGLKIHHVHNRVRNLWNERQPNDQRDKSVLAEYGGLKETLAKIRKRFPNKDAFYLQKQTQCSEIDRAARNFTFVFSDFKHDEVARKMLEESGRIIFLGFGFHPTNLQKIGYNSLHKERKEIYGTCYGMSQLDRMDMENNYPEIKLYDGTGIDFFKKFHRLSWIQTPPIEYSLLNVPSERSF